MTPTTKNQLQDTNNDYVYDAAGNLIQPGPIGGPYVFDAENHLISAGGMDYLYDGDGKRVGKAPASAPTQPNYLYWYGMGPDILEETDGAGNYLYRDFRFNGMLLARGEDDWVDHFFADALDNTRCVYGDNDPDGGCSDYYPFGGERPIASSNNGVNVPFKFTGKERDSESGLDNFGARYNSSNFGRFMSPDPLMASATVYNPQTWNRYTYALNNPLKFIDPNGLKEVSADDCKKDSKCVTVKLNVVYDANANGGKGLTDKQKEQFQGQLQGAKDQFGDSNVHFDVTYTAGSVTSGGDVTGTVQGAANIFVSDHTFSGEAGDSGRLSGGAFGTILNINKADSDTLSHELGHHILGDTSGFADRLEKAAASLDPTLGVLVGAPLNLYADLTNDATRGNTSPDAFYRMKVEQVMNARETVRQGAQNLSQLLTQQAAIRPRQ